MQSTYLNLLSISPCAKEIPYLGTGIPREDGQINHGFKNLIAHPDLIDAIPELASDPAMRSLVYRLNTGDSRFFTTGCFSSQVSGKFGYRYHGYLEFSWNCRACIRDAINYFSIFFHFEQFLHAQKFDQKVKFEWSIGEIQFTDINTAGFCCAVFINTADCSSSDLAHHIWQVSLAMLESFLGSVPVQSSQSIY